MDFRAHVRKRKQKKRLIRRNFHDYSDYVAAKLVNMRRKNKRHGKEIARTLHKTPLRRVKHRSWFKQMLDNPVRYALLQMISNRYLNAPAVPIYPKASSKKKSEETAKQQEDHQPSTSSSVSSPSVKPKVPMVRGAPPSSLAVPIPRNTPPAKPPRNTPPAKPPRNRISSREVSALLDDQYYGKRKHK